jgi:hypothetical protein
MKKLWPYAIKKIGNFATEHRRQLVQWISRRHLGKEVYAEGWVELYLKHKMYAIDSEETLDGKLSKSNLTITFSKLVIFYL